MIQATEISCEYAKNPIGIDTLNPRFSWIVDSAKRSAKQGACQILVASDPDLLESETGDMWDSGKVASDRSVNQTYAGKPLQSFGQYWWKVRLWNLQGIQSGYSEVGYFEMGLLKQRDWKTKWIGMNAQALKEQKLERDTKDIAPIFRREFVVSKKVRDVRAYFSGLGWGELSVNGRKVGNSVLDPGPTDYDRSIPYVSHDITNFILPGDNCLGIMLGNGWFSEYGFALAYGKSPKTMLLVRIRYEDGTAECLATDNTWKITSGPITENQFWGGEVYDANFEKEGWNCAGFDDSDWAAASIRDRGRGLMKSQVLPPIEINETADPVNSREVEPGVWVYDMGQLFGGWVRIQVKGKKGAKVTIRYSDRLTEKGTVEQKFQFKAPSNDVYILKGNPEGETYEPRFTYHPANYVQIEIEPDAVAIGRVQGRKIYNSVDFSGSFSSSNPLLNKIHEAAKRTLKNELFNIPLDCLDREHWGWIDPATITGTLYPRQFMPLFWIKWLEDIRESQFENGAIPDIAPNYLQWKNIDPAWGGNYPIMVWYLYRYYDDVRILEEHYDSTAKLMDYFSSVAEGQILYEGNYGDHMIPGEAPGKEDFISPETPPPFVWTGYYYRGAYCMARAAETLQKTGDVEYYDNLAEKIKTAIQNKWLDADACRYVEGSQTASFLPLSLGIVPEACREKLVENAARDIREKYHLHHHTGNTGTTCMIDTLTKYGHGQLLYDVVNQETYPGWGYMMAQGATTIWESWSVDNTVGCELSMSMYATIDEFFYNDLAGIRGPDYYGPEAFVPGFSKILIAPLVPKGLQSAGATIRTVKGRVSSLWTQEEKELVLEVSIPPNAEAIVRVPENGKDITIRENQELLWENHEFVPGIDGVVGARKVKDQHCIQISIGSGNYRFTVAGRQ